MPDKDKPFSNKLLNLPTDSILNEFSKYISLKRANDIALYHKNMMESLFEDNEIKIILSGNNILKIIKYSVKYDLKYLSNFDRIILANRKKTPIEQDDISSDNDIEILNTLTEDNQYLIFQYVVYISIVHLKDKTSVLELFEKSKYQKDY